MLSDIARLAKRVAKGPAQEHGSWWSRLFRQLTLDADRHGWDTIAFNLSGNQSHGPITQSSRGGEHDGVNLRLVQLSGHLRRRHRQQHRNMRAINMSHETVVPRGNTSNLSFSRALFEPLKRENDVHILVRIAVVIIIVRDNEPTPLRAARNSPIARIPILVRHIEW